MTFPGASPTVGRSCSCQRCQPGCTGKVQKNRVVCARCRDKRCECRVCGQRRTKINKDHPNFKPACNCIRPTRKKTILRLEQIGVPPRPDDSPLPTSSEEVAGGSGLHLSAVTDETPSPYVRPTLSMAKQPRALVAAAGRGAPQTLSPNGAVVGPCRARPILLNPPVDMPCHQTKPVPLVDTFLDMPCHQKPVAPVVSKQSAGGVGSVIDILTAGSTTAALVTQQRRPFWSQEHNIITGPAKTASVVAHAASAADHAASAAAITAGSLAAPSMSCAVPPGYDNTTNSQHLLVDLPMPEEDGRGLIDVDADLVLDANFWL